MTSIVPSEGAVKLEPRPDDGIAFLNLLRPAGPWLFTAISSKSKSIETREFGPGDAVLKWIATKNRAGWNVYYHVNPIKARLDEKGNPIKANLDDVIQAEFIFADIDRALVGKGEEEPAETCKAGALKRLASYNPTFIVDSGNGIQALWRLAEPSTDFDDVEARNRTLVSRLGGDKAVHDVPRILRLPGTVNWLA